MEITIRKVKDIRGRRIIGYVASYGQFSIRADTPQEAKSRLEAFIPQAIGHLTREPVTFAFAGYSVTVFPEAWNDSLGWGSKIVCPDGHICQASHGTDNEQKAENSVRMHIAQMVYPDPCAWEVLKGNDAISDFKNWALFQVRYQILKQLGYSDHECHGIASGNPTMPAYHAAVEARA